MRLRNTYLTGVVSYLQMGSQVLVGLATIPLALHFLDNEEFGLWAFITQSLGYLLLLDLGIGHSLGRLLAEPLHTGNEQEWNGWFNLALVLFTIQATLILGLGLWLVNPILHWFPIPAPLFPQARELWLIVVILNAIMFPLRVFRGIVIAQNRSYWMYGGNTLGAWGGLLFFYVFLRAGWGVLAYGWMAVAQMALTMGLPLAATLIGPHRFRLSWRNLPWRHLRELFGFSSAVFIMGIVAQIVLMSQSLIITKILGLAAVASFTVCSRVPMLLLQAVGRPLDAFVPRWQIFWARDQKTELAGEFRSIFRFTMGLAAVAMVCCFALNRWFVFIFAKPELYAGKTFDLFLELSVMVFVWNGRLTNCFTLAKRVKGVAIAASVSTLLFLVAAVAGTKWYGLTGYAAFTAIYSLTGVGIWYQTLKGPRQLGLRPRDLVREHRLNLLVFFALMVAGWLAFRETKTTEQLLVAETALSVAALAWFVGHFRHDLLAMLRRLQQVWQNRSGARSGAPPVG